MEEILHNFPFPVTICVYINTEYWPEHSFNKMLWKYYGTLSHFLQTFLTYFGHNKSSIKS